MELVIAVASFLLGYFAEKLFDKLGERLAERHRIRKNRKNHQQILAEEALDIVYTGDIYPSIAPQYVRTALRQDCYLYLAFPEALRDRLEVEKQATFQTADVAFCSFTLPGYEESAVREAIEAARLEVAQQFIRQEDGLYYNSDKYGVYHLDTLGRTADVRETPLLSLQVYQTDHFTHRVIGRALERLAPPVALFDEDSLNGDLKWVRTSFGVSIIVVLKSVNQIILTHRSTKASFSEGKSWIYVSATEPMSGSDMDEYQGRPDLVLCVERGLEEELGIDSSLYSRSHIKFYDCFFETKFHQDGVVASVELDDDVLPEKVLSLRAKDKRLEVADMFFIDNTPAAIKKFIRENRQDMRSQTVFALKSYLAEM
ncbi:MAG: hypothetical protein IJ518_00620 [Clostridia bacterium]|nr:hypothetical protein [Clostridia bacterium]